MKTLKKIGIILLKVFRKLFTKQQCCKSILIFLVISNTIHAQKVVRYDLYVNDTLVNYTGKKVKAISVNGQIPAPTLYFTQGDTAEIYVHNKMNKETSIHWHGIILPNEQDGVPYLTTAPIKAHTTHLYKFPVVQNGTYWYHAHTELQEQSGLYGALVFYKKQKDTIPEYTMVLSDWTNEKPAEVLRTLKLANDWYAIKKGSTQNYGEAIVKGYLGAKLKQEWLRMFPMDVSDVYYNVFLMNGQEQQALPKYKAGDKVKLRIVNGSSSTYFWVQFAGGKLTAVASDGEDVEPVQVDRMIIGVAETYDVIITIPSDMSYEFRATAEDRTKYTSLWLGSGMKMPAPTMLTLKYFAGMKMMNGMMKFNGSMENMGMQMSNQQMDMNTVMYPEITGEEKKKKHSADNMENMKMDSSMQMNMSTYSGGNIVTLNYGMLKSIRKTTLPYVPTKTLVFNLTGNMNRYQWSINNRTLADTDKILIKKGENIRIILNNQTMMRHPMHLHGHYFRVLNGQGDYAPLKNVLDIMPMEVDTIEFAAEYYGDWFFHCHILYHMMSGMGRIFSYENSSANMQVDTIKHAWRKFLSDGNMWHPSVYIAAQSNEISPQIMAMNDHYMFDGFGMINYMGSYESETRFGRLFGRRQFLEVFVGSDIRGINHGNNPSPDSKEHMIENRKVATFGIEYTLPMFIQTELRVDSKGNFRLQIKRNDFALTSRLRLDAMWNTDMEYEVGLRYVLLKRLALSVNYDSHFGPGGGLTFTY